MAIGPENGPPVPTLDQTPARKRAGAIDIGTNTVLLTIADVSAPAARTQLNSATNVPSRPHLHVISEHHRVTRLGQGVDRNRRLLDEAMDRTLDCLRDFREECDRAGVTELSVVGTSALRDAREGQRFRETAEDILGAAVEVVSGTQEGELTFLGALSGLDPDELARAPQKNDSSEVIVFDIGGGSTELVLGRLSGRMDVVHSLELGSVRLAERHRPNLSEARRSIDAALSQLPSLPSVRDDAVALGLAGTMTTMWAVTRGIRHLDSTELEGAHLTLEEVRTLCARFRALSVSETAALFGMERGRADVIAYGALICERLMTHLALDDVRISERGVRHGLLLRGDSLSRSLTPR